MCKVGKIFLMIVMLFFIKFCNQRVNAAYWDYYKQVGGVGNVGDGAGIAFVNLDNNDRPEMVLMAYDDPDGGNKFRYKIGWNVDANGKASSWSSYVQVGGVGNQGEGADIAFINLDNNARPEMILMAYDAPSGSNKFRYKIGWNVKTNGRATSWSSYIRVGGVGKRGDGAGVAFINLDNNTRPEMILMAYDDPSGGNSFRYKISDGPSTKRLCEPTDGLCVPHCGAFYIKLSCCLSGQLPLVREGLCDVLQFDQTNGEGFQLFCKPDNDNSNAF